MGSAEGGKGWAEGEDVFGSFRGGMTETTEVRAYFLYAALIVTEEGGVARA